MAVTRTSISPVTLPDNLKRSIVNVCDSGTEADPLASTDGMDLSGVRGYVVTVEADSGQTLSGTGTLYAFLWNGYSGVWDYAPDLNKAIPSSASGKRGCGFVGDFVSSPCNRIEYRPNAVGVSSGKVNIFIWATDNLGAIR